ncbi:MAG: tetratricopeptide repeat protein [Rhodobacteraceae bacterium]|nr:tetratricopeptide repeat protein [Paracoccaceae bacterium]
MGTRRRYLNTVVAAAAVALNWAGAAAADQNAPRLEELFSELQAPDTVRWQMVERQIWSEWSKSGSPAMDLLLQRGQQAMEAGDLDEAIAHFTALVDHAPDFAEGWNARATAYFQAGLYGPSLADIRMTLALNPRHFGALSGLGRILEELGEPEQALAAYRAAHAIHPHQPGIKAGIERLELRTGGQAL